MVENSKKEDGRRFKRFPTDLDAMYLLEGKEEWKGCSVINISREGMGIEVYLHEKTHTGNTLHLKIIIPTKERPINATGILVWIKEPKKKMDFIVGVKFTKIDYEDKWTLLDYAYDNLPKKGE